MARIDGKDSVSDDIPTSIWCGLSYPTGIPCGSPASWKISGEIEAKVCDGHLIAGLFQAGAQMGDVFVRRLPWASGRRSD